MLVMTRKIGEAIRIGDDIKIIFKSRKKGGSGSIRLVIDAPKEVPVHREEIYLARKKEEESRRALDS